MTDQAKLVTSNMPSLADFIASDENVAADQLKVMGSWLRQHVKKGKKNRKQFSPN